MEDGAREDRRETGKHRFRKRADGKLAGAAPNRPVDPETAKEYPDGALRDPVTGRFAPGTRPGPGRPGRPPGERLSRRLSTALRQIGRESEVEELLHEMIDSARNGDTVDRDFLLRNFFFAPTKEAPTPPRGVTVPEIHTVDDALETLRIVAQASARGASPEWAKAVRAAVTDWLAAHRQELEEGEWRELQAAVAELKKETNP